jgi:hypothetical protein
MGRYVTIRGRTGDTTWVVYAHDPLVIWLVGTGWVNRVSYGVMGNALGLSRSAIAGIVHRNVRSIPALRSERTGSRHHPVSALPRNTALFKSRAYDTAWDQRLFEPYAVRKARRLNGTRK